MNPKFLFLFLIYLIPIAAATGFSPGSLIFELQPNQQECQIITLDSDSELITVSDSWAENKDVEWKVSLFDTTAETHGININYPTELSQDERKVEVCLSGSQAGEYHGAIIFRQQQQGNSIVQLAVWLKATITEDKSTSPTQPSPTTSGGSSQNSQPNPQKSQQPEIQNLASEALENQQNLANPTPQQAPITGNAINESQSKISPIPIIILILIIFTLLIYRRFK